MATPRGSGVALTVSIVVVFVLLFAVLLGFYWYFRRKHDDIRLIASVNPDYAGHIYVEDEWERERGNIEIHNELNRGEFCVGGPSGRIGCFLFRVEYLRGIQLNPLSRRKELSPLFIGESCAADALCEE